MEPVVKDTRRGYRLSGRLNIGRLLQGEIFRALAPAVASDGSNSPTVVAPTGFGSQLVCSKSPSRGWPFRYEGSQVATAVNQPALTSGGGGR